MSFFHPRHHDPKHTDPVHQVLHQIHKKRKNPFKKALTWRITLGIFFILAFTHICLYLLIVEYDLHYQFFILTAILSFVLTIFFLWKVVLKPIFHLQNKLEALSHDIRHPQLYISIPRYRDEINVVYIKMNEFLKKLDDALRNVRAHEAIMELRIQERTKELTQLANYDIVTDLPNRILFKELVTQTISLAQQEKRQAMVLILQLLDFHEITSALGHETSNLFLKELGKFLIENLPQHCHVAHLSTTHFAIARNHFINTIQIADIAKWILDLFSKPLRITNNNILTAVNMGISVYPNDGLDAESLISNANLALERSKETLANTFQFYQAEMNSLAEVRRNLLVDLHYALEKNEFVIYYQPQVDLKTKKIIGAEALLRWNHPEQGLLSPSKFITLAEDSGLIIPIGEWLINTVCQQMLSWENLGLKNLNVAINLSPVQFKQKGIVDTLSKILNETGVDPAKLELEITESTIMTNIDVSIMTMKAIHSLGISLAMDDFGTGYSSLSYINQFPLQKIKIDQSFVSEIIEENAENVLVDIIILLGKSLKLKILAEGVETEFQLNSLKEKGCDEAQGYLFGKAMPADKFIELIKK